MEHVPSVSRSKARSVAPTAAASAAAAASAWGSLLGFVDLEDSAVQRRPVELRDGGIGCRRVAHRDERETSRPARFTIGWDRDFANLACLGEEGLKIGLGGVVRKISDV